LLLDVDVLGRMILGDEILDVGVRDDGVVVGLEFF
jgi:hypothetical protein